MNSTRNKPITRVIGELPYRLALAGGWIDQPFVSKFNPQPPGSMVVVSVEPTLRFMDRSGLATGTRAIAQKLWKRGLPSRDPEVLVRELYRAENEGKTEPSGSQDMIGLLYPGINRLDYDYEINQGVFPCHIETVRNQRIVRWLERVLHILPVAPRPDGYNPLEVKRLTSNWVGRLARSGRDCFDSILKMDAVRLGASFNECMRCWETLLPGTVRHNTLQVELLPLLRHYQVHFHGAMYSGCGGGYLFVVSEQPVDGAFRFRIRA